LLSVFLVIVVSCVASIVQRQVVACMRKWVLMMMRLEGWRQG